MLLIKNTARARRRDIEKALGENTTREQVLDYIFGCYDTDYDSSADIVVYTWESDDRTVRHRLNMFWAMPLTLLLAPIMYIKDGQIGWSTKSALGRFVLKAVGLLKD